MKANLLLRQRTPIMDGVRVERVLWLVPTPVRGSRHRYKYRYALIADDICVLRYDNEAGKGDHRHIGELQRSYEFTDASTLLADFLDDVMRWIDANRRD